jgi:hypothetical protein
MEMRLMVRTSKRNVGGQRKLMQINKIIRQRLGTSPACSHDHFKLELPGTWEPPVSSISSPAGEEEEAPTGLPYGDQNVAKKGRPGKS